MSLATSERLSVPAAIGFFQPMIVVPAWALHELPPEELKIVLLHEFAHLRRWDDWTNLLQKFVRAMFFFHPAVWWIERRLSLEREMACDDAVLAATANPRGYAQCLIALLEKSVARRGWAMAQAAVHRAREASLRLARILDASRPQTRQVWKPALGMVSVFSLLCLAAVTRAPQLVAFEPNQRTIHNEEVRASAISSSPFSAVSVIPAGLRTSSSTSLQESTRRPAARAAERRVFKHPVARPDGAPQVFTAFWTADTQGGPAEDVTAGAIPAVATQSEALLVIRTAQRVGPNSWSWSVSVWRVKLVNPAQEARLANKT